MYRLLAALLVAPLVLQAQARPRKIFISADMEGIAGVEITKLQVSSLEAP